MLRGALIGLIHQNSLILLPSYEASEKENSSNTPTNGGGMRSSSSSTPVALVTTDVAALEDAVETFYMTWACAIEVIIGTVMLARQVGWLWPLPHIITVFCSRISAYVARNMKTRQAEWNAATRKRIAMTSSVLSSAKTVKMLGMQQAVEKQILELRKDETDKAARVRWIMVIYNASGQLRKLFLIHTWFPSTSVYPFHFFVQETEFRGVRTYLANALGMFAPVITIVVFAILAAFRGQSLNPETAFPTIAILALVTHSANMIMTIIPKAVAAYPSFERIQSYLQPTSLSSTPSSPVLPRNHHHDGDNDVTAPAILIKDLDVSWKNGQQALSGINLTIPRGSIVACSGPVGSGKTTLARAILGEIRTSSGGGSGVVETSTGRIAYCAQTAWLPNRTIKEVILGPANTTMNFRGGYDEDVVDGDECDAWYEIVIRACCLDEDFATTLPEGDATSVGDGGMNLSGGQRQRVVSLDMDPG